MDWQAISVQKTEAKYLFNLLDIEESGEISFDEFMDGCLRLHGAAKSFDLLVVMQEQRAMVKAWDTHTTELHKELGDLRQPILTTARLTTVCSECMENVVDMLHSSQDHMLRMEMQIQQQASALSMTKCLEASVDNSQSLLNTVAGLPAGGALPKSTPKGWPQALRPANAGVAVVPGPGSCSECKSSTEFC